MSVSTVGAAGGASELVEVDHDEAPLAVQPASEGAQTGSVSGFDDAKAQTLVLNPQAPLLEIDRSADTQGKKKGTNDDSIGDGRTGGTRPADVIPTMVAKGPIDIEAVTAGLSDTAKAQVTALLADPATTSDATYAFTSPTFNKLEADQREKFIDIMALGGPRATQLLAMGCEVCGDISALRANDGSTVLDNLDKMVKRPDLAPYTADVLADMVMPERIWQGNAPTCTSATMQFELAKRCPAEYSRLITGLAIDGTVQMAGGGTLETQPGAALNGSLAANDKRSPTEAVFQAALMEFANGTETYDYNKMISTGNGKSHRGLNGEQIQTALTQLFGTAYKITKISSNDEAAAALTGLNRSLTPNRPVLIDLVVDDNTNHCVAFEGFSNGRVQLRDPETGQRTSISEQEFLEKAAAVHVAPQRRVRPDDPTGTSAHIFIQ